MQKLDRKSHLSRARWAEKPCIRGMRVMVGTVVGLVAAGHSIEKILRIQALVQVDSESLRRPVAYTRMDCF